MDSRVWCRPLRLHYFVRIPNFGDRINPAIVEAVSGEPTILDTRRDAPHLCAVGSLIAATTPQSFIWGTGVIHPDYGLGSALPERIFALRGKLSHSALRMAGVPVPDVTLGDPAVLAPALMDIRRSRTPKYRIGLVPHYVDRRQPAVQRLLSLPDVVDLNVHQEPEDVLRLMAECETVVSSSLHGLIFAEALGIPNLWVTSSTQIAGGSFKFDDWFSTTAAPQTSAHPLGEEDSVAELSERAMLHDCTIDHQQLIAAFPRTHLQDLQEESARPIMRVSSCRRAPTPVFFISYNRGDALQSAIASVKQQDQQTDIIVHDNGSDDPATMCVLDDLTSKGIKVERCCQIYTADDLNSVNNTVVSFFADWAEPARYVVSDCDIDIGIASASALRVFDELLNLNRHVESVGPMLRIEDIQQSYPLYAHVMNRHIEQFWHKQPNIIQTTLGAAAIIEGVIDTTFALNRAGEPYRRMKSALRVYEPYEARHLDWYLEDIGTAPYAATSSPDISHWGNSSQQDAHIATGLLFDRYVVVRRDETGELRTETVRLPNVAAHPSIQRERDA